MENTKEAMENVLRKIKKLFDLAEGAKAIGSLAEAANAAEKAQNLLIKHNLSMAEVKGVEVSDVTHHRVPGSEIYYEKREGAWIPNLIGGICSTNLCKCMITSYPRSENMDFTIIGEPDNVAMVLEVSLSLIFMGRHLFTKAWSNYIGPEKRGKFRRGFLMGFSMGISKQLRESFNRLQQGDSNVTALVHVSSEAVDKYMNNKFNITVKRARSNRLSSNDGLHKGFQEGLKTKISNQKSLDNGNI